MRVEYEYIQIVIYYIFWKKLRYLIKFFEICNLYISGEESFWFHFIFFYDGFPLGSIGDVVSFTPVYSFSCVRPRVACVRALIAVGTLASVPWTFTTIRSFVYKIERLHRPEAWRKEEGRRLALGEARKGWGGVILRGATPTLDFRRDKLTEAYDTSWPFVER